MSLRALCVGVSLTLLPLGAAAADTGCNQLGREVALRAAEQLQTRLDAAARSELAGIAEAVCLEYTQPPEQDAAAVTEGGQDAAAAGSASAEEPWTGPFDLKLIAPEDRVRRAGLKRR